MEAISLGDVKPISHVENIDNMLFMAKYPDKFFDLAVVDPPYNLNKKITGGRFARYGSKQAEWDNQTPDDNYFNELFRVSNNQIVWGANYMPNLWKSPCRGFVFWDKIMTVSNYSAGELAWTSFDFGAKLARIEYNGFLGSDKNRIHPTQKPIELYKWIIKTYAKPGDKLLDTHLGSQSSRIAAYKLGFDFYGCEIDEDYFKEGCARFDRECNGIIEAKNGAKIIQQSLF